MRKYHVRFLGGGEAAMPPRYPTNRQTILVEPFFFLVITIGTVDLCLLVCAAFFIAWLQPPGCTKQLTRVLAGQPFAWASRLQAPRPAPRKSCVPHVGSSRRRAHAPKSVASSGSTLREGSLRAKSFSSAPPWKKPSGSGLVFSPTACEGSKTGFYSDDYEE